MIYDVTSFPRLPHGVYGAHLNDAYTLAGDSIMYEEGFSDGFNAFDPDQWKHLDGPYRSLIYLPQDCSNNAFVEDGCLVFRNLRDEPTGQYDWSGAWLYTDFTFQHGIVEARIRFSTDADSYHATLWMLGAENRGNGEIDIAEANSGRVTCAVHWKDEDGETLYSKNIGVCNDTASLWHVYTIIWTDERMAFYCDGKYVGGFKVDDATVNAFNSFRQPFYLVVNSLPYDVSRKEFATSESATNYIDYVKVYRVKTG